MRKLAKRLIISIIILSIIVLTYYLATTKSLPPLDIQNHVEENPPSHIMKKPIPILIQKHMLEHADGSGRPGVVINYDCKNYECESDLIPKLEEYARIYDYVYVAPYRNMKAKIVLTKLGQREILDGYDNQTITEFII